MNYRWTPAITSALLRAPALSVRRHVPANTGAGTWRGFAQPGPATIEAVVDHNEDPAVVPPLDIMPLTGRALGPHVHNVFTARVIYGTGCSIEIGSVSGGTSLQRWRWSDAMLRSL